MEKTISLRNAEITFSIWDLGGRTEFLSMLPLVCNDALAMFFMFDLSRKSTLLNVKEWYRQARGLNRVSSQFLLYKPLFIMIHSIAFLDGACLPCWHQI